jgi:hypothetical protein
MGEKPQEIVSSEKPLDLSKLESQVEEEKDVIPTFKLKGNDLMFGDKIIANKMDFETNKSLLETQEEISPVMAHNKGYKFEMLYTRPSHPVLFAEDEEKPSPPKAEDIPKTPSGTPPQIQIERAKIQTSPSSEMEVVYDSDEDRNIGD